MFGRYEGAQNTKVTQRTRRRDLCVTFVLQTSFLTEFLPD